MLTGPGDESAAPVAHLDRSLEGHSGGPADPAAGPFAYYGPPKSYRYALEVNTGFFARHEISERAEVRFIPTEGGGIPAHSPIEPWPFAPKEPGNLAFAR